MCVGVGHIGGTVAVEGRWRGEPAARCAPLRTVYGLKGATATMEWLYRIPGYISSVGGKQEVMIGYSDSIKGKDDQRRGTGWARPSTRSGHERVFENDVPADAAHGSAEPVCVLSERAAGGDAACRLSCSWLISFYQPSPHWSSNVMRAGTKQ